MKALILIGLAIAGTLAFSYLKPKESAKAGSQVVKVSKQVGAAAEKAAKQGKAAIHKATAETQTK